MHPLLAHDVRRTCAIDLATLGLSSFVIGRILNHSEHGVTGICNRWQYVEEIRQVLDVWGKRLKELASAASSTEATCDARESA
jgi:hypothetical protein